MTGRDEIGIGRTARLSAKKNAAADGPEAVTGITGIVLCGGRGRRLQGADKPLLRWQGETLVSRVVQRLRPQVDGILISANRNLDAYRRLAPVAADELPDFQGPLAGIAATLGQCATPWAVVCPGDAPLIPMDLVEHLAAAIGAAPPADGRRTGPDGKTANTAGPRLGRKGDRGSVLEAPRRDRGAGHARLGRDGVQGSAPVSAAFARVGGRRHYLHCLLRTDVAGHLRDHLAAGRLDAKGWLEALGAVAVDFPGQDAAFRNFNAPEDFAETGK